MKSYLKAAGALACVLFGAGASQASTVTVNDLIDFSTTPAGYTITGTSITNGNCPFDTKPCSHLNDNATIEVSRGGNAFDFNGATFRFQGNGTKSLNGVLFEGFVWNTVTSAYDLVASALFNLGASSGFGDGSIVIGSLAIDNKVDYAAAFDASFDGISLLRITSNKIEPAVTTTTKTKKKEDEGDKSAQLRIDGLAVSYLKYVPDPDPEPETPAVPLPASGLLLLGGLGAFAAARGRRNA